MKTTFWGHLPSRIITGLVSRWPSVLFGLISDELHTNQERALANTTLVPRRKRLRGFRRMSLPAWKKNLILVQLETRCGQNRHLSLWFLFWVSRLVSLQATSFQGEEPESCREVWETLISKGGGKAWTTDLKSFLVDRVDVSFWSSNWGLCIFQAALSPKLDVHFF